jgi:hypothetical protein
MTKIFYVNECIVCHFADRDTGQKLLCFAVMPYKRIDNEKVIPNWCPLPDKEEC